MKQVSSSTNRPVQDQYEQGTIIRGVGGFYYVRLHERAHHGIQADVVECKARGLFRKEGLKPMVGDEALIEVQRDNTGYIKDILPRRNAFIRPPVSNIEQMALVMALADPEPNLDVLDKFLVSAEKNDVKIILIFNKTDLGLPAMQEKLQSIYAPLYPLHFVCGKSGQGLERIKEMLAGKKTAFAGPSGVGKSTLINLLSGEAGMETGGISKKTGRGKHTTRHVELIRTDFDALLFDTPGFTSFDIAEIEKEELQLYFPEIESRRDACRFNVCSHISEPGCAVKEALLQGEISQSRYTSYAGQYKALQDTKKW